jgi:hypothetical protein
MLKSRLVFAALFVTTGLAASATAQVPAPPPPSAKVGVLNCNMSAGVGMIIGGRQNLACQFVPSAARYAPETYVGEITTLGLDVGVQSGGKMAWAVLMPTEGPQHGALSGDYVGASGQVALGVGGGANVLVGGSGRSVTLQPFSVEGDTGINLAVGVSGMVLRPAQ